MRARKTACAALTSMGMVAALSACGTEQSTGEESSESLTIGITTPPQSLDPYTCLGGTVNLQVSAYDSLLRLTPEGTYEPSLAESWEFVSPTELSMTLRPGVEFADGTPLDAEVVKANLERAAATPTAVTTQFAAAQPTITVDSDLSLTVALSRPNPDLLYFLSSCGGMIVHPDLVADPQAMASTMNGTGPYTYDEQASIANSSYVFNRRDGYWNAEAYPFDTVTFPVVPDLNAGFNALTTGQVDVVPGPLELSEQAQAAGLESVSDAATTLTIKFNDLAGELVPALGDVRVRQALNYAIDREAILQTFFGGEGAPRAQVLNPEASGYDPDLDDQYSYDPQKAKELLAEAGYADGFTIQVLSTGINQFSDVVEAVGSYWQEIGVTLEQAVKPPPEFLAGRATTDYPAVFTPIFGFPAYTNLVQNFGPGSPLNPFQATDPALTQALEQATTGNLEEGGDPAALREAQTALLDQAWYAAIGDNTVTIYYDPDKVTGIEPRPDQTTPIFYDWQPAG